MNISHEVKMKLVFDDEKKPFFLDVTTLFYDLELLHDLFLLLYVEDYHDYKFSRRFFYRRGRPLKSNHRLRTFRIIKESPLTIELIVSIVVVSSGAFWALIQAIEKIVNYKINREKLKLEIEKLRRENNLISYREEITKMEKELQEKELQERECFKILNSLLKRLESNPIKLKDIDLTSKEYDDEKSR